MTQIGTVIDGKYEILKEIGRGGMSIVYLAMDKRLNKQWAVKEIRKKGTGTNDEIVVNSLLAEANLMKRLDHPSLPRIVDIIFNDATIYVVMDYIEGESLDKILEEYGAQPEELVIGWAKQLCDAMSYLHGQKPPIIYRDMKPANVMLKPEGNIKIIDFGIAREYKEKNLADTTVLGTKGYAPPEQYNGQTDHRSDIYALGKTMHHLLTGADPRVETYAPVRQWNPELSEGIETIIEKCVQPAAENRYQSCSELLYDLEHPELITRDFKRRQKRRLAAFLTAVGLSILLAIGGAVCNLAASNINNGDYDRLISSSTPENYVAAVHIYPDRPEAYLALIEYYREQSELSDQQARVIQNLYDGYYGDEFAADTAEAAEVNHALGTLLLMYCDTANKNVAQRAKLANTYFERNQQIELPYSNQELSECYYQICVFAKDFMLNEHNDAQLDDYLALFDNVEHCLQVIGTEDSFSKLALYSVISDLLYEQRRMMAQTGVDVNVVLELFDQAYVAAMEIPTNENRPQQQEMQQKIKNNYESRRSSIENVFAHEAERREE